MLKLRGFGSRQEQTGQRFGNMGKHENLEELPTLRPGDRVLRRGRKPRGILRAVVQSMPKLPKRRANKQPGE